MTNNQEMVVNGDLDLTMKGVQTLIKFAGYLKEENHISGEFTLGYNNNSGYHYIWSEYLPFSIGISDFNDYAEIIVTNSNNGKEHFIELKSNGKKSLLSGVEKAFKLNKKINK